MVELHNPDMLPTLIVGYVLGALTMFIVFYLVNRWGSK